MSSYIIGPGQFKTNDNNQPAVTIEGTSSDTKPSAATYAGYYFYETDTKNNFLAYNGVWNQIIKISTGTGSGGALLHSGPYKYIVYIDTNDSNKVKALNTSTGIVDSSSSSATPETPIQFALTANTGGVFISAGQYQFSAGFTGLQIATNNHLVMDGRSTILSVPTGYTGPVIRLGPSGTPTTSRVYTSVIEGGWINDPSLPTNRSTGNSTPGTFIGVQFNCAGSLAAGQAFNIVKDVYIENAAVGLQLVDDGRTVGNYITSNTFDNLYMMTPNIGVQFVTPGGIQNSITENQFKHCVIQSGSNTTNGFMDINGWGNTFLQCMLWDAQIMSSPAISCNITALCTQPNFIIGGLITQSNFADLSPTGKRTFLLDSFNQKISSPDATVTLGKVTAQGRNVMLPSVMGRKWGIFTGNASPASSTGIWQSGFSTLTTGAGASAVYTGTNISTTQGTYYTFTTGATTGSEAGIRYIGSLTHMTKFNTRLRIRCRVNQTTNNRFYIGTGSSNNDWVVGDDPTATFNAVVVGQRSTDSVYVIGTNSATGAGTYVNYNKDGAGGTMSCDASFHTYEITFTATSVSVQIDNNNIHTITSPVPSSTTGLYCPIIDVQTNENVAHSMDVEWAEMEVDWL